MSVTNEKLLQAILLSYSESTKNAVSLQKEVAGLRDELKVLKSRFEQSQANPVARAQTLYVEHSRVRPFSFLFFSFFFFFFF